MKLAEVAIRRPVFTVMMIVALVVLGYASFNLMSVDLMPNISFPFVIVSTVYPGAGAEAVETELTKKIEDAINPISGVKHITSYSQESYSFVFAEFVLEKDPQVAAQEVREKVSAIRGDLPKEIEAPVIARYDPESQPIMSLSVAGTLPPREITTITKDEIQKRLESIPGVGSVTLVGGFEREIDVLIDIKKMESYEISVDQVKTALAAANLEIPGGRVNEDNTEYLIRTMGKLTRVSQFNNIVIDNPDGQPVYLKDIATIIDGVQEQRSLARLNGQTAITLDVSKQSGANTVDVARNVKAAVSLLQRELPPGINLNIVVDDSKYIEDSIDDVMVNILYGGLLAVLVIFLFLADIRSTIISAVAIPASIVATFTLMNALGFTLNILSLMGLSLAVGLLIDDAIVVIENIFRHLDEGEKPFKAAYNATKEIGLAVMATTFSIMVVFIPVAFMQGIVGRFFYQFGMTVAFAVAVSLFVAFTLTPMLSSRFLRKEGAEVRGPKFILFRLIWKIYRLVLRIIAPWNRFFNYVNVLYRATLQWALKHRLAIVVIAILSFVFALYLGKFVGSEFMPQTDEGRVMISVETPPGTDLKVTADRIAQAEALISKFQGIDLIFTTLGSGQNQVSEGQIYIKLVDKNERPLSARQMVDSLRKVVTAAIPGVKFAFATEADEGGSSRQVELSIRGNDLNILADLSNKVENIFRKTPGIVDINNNLEKSKPELKITVDRDAANDLGVNIYLVASTIRSLVDGEVVTRYKEGDKEYDVRVRLKESDRAGSADIDRILIASNKDVEGRRSFMVPLSHFARVEKSASVGKYNRYDRLREIKVGGNVLEGYFPGTMLDNIVTETKKIDLPPGYYIGKTGMGEIQEESFGYIFFSLMLAVIFVYLLLASQFESFFDPFSIMFSLPMSLVGAIVALLIFGNSISIMSLIGIIMLMGLVTKNAILLVDFIKQNRYRGISRTEAILIAGPIRLRPILMTTFAMVFGMFPLIFAFGPGAELRAPMARAVVGGLISSTLLTLVVVPVVYTIIDDIVVWFTGRETVQVRKEDFTDEGTVDQAG
ncbi:MAG: efflux RND transporter permease subunit [candidate division Zixibacteria bacterium]|nr:efflux RND transporter permease subunit [candidate division Zixibacteria bacterium]